MTNATRTAVLAAAAFSIGAVAYVGLRALPALQETAAAPAAEQTIAPGLTSTDAAAPVPPALPRSLQGTEIDGELDLDAKGHFAPNPQARALFDYFLSATGEESDDVIRARIVTHVRTTLPHDAAAEAEQILDLYLRYRAHMREQSATTSPPADLERRLQWIREERRKIFGAEVADALFGEEEEVVRLDLERRRIALDTTLSPAEKTARLEALEARLPERVHAARHDAAAPARLEQQVDALRASGAGDAAVFAAREREFGTEAAQRLAALDAESDAWQARVDAYRAESARLRTDASLSPSEREARIEALRAARFDEQERIRIRALDEETPG